MFTYSLLFPCCCIFSFTFITCYVTMLLHLTSVNRSAPSTNSPKNPFPIHITHVACYTGTFPINFLYSCLMQWTPRLSLPFKQSLSVSGSVHMITCSCFPFFFSIDGYQSCFVQNLHWSLQQVLFPASLLPNRHHC